MAHVEHMVVAAARDVSYRYGARGEVLRNVTLEARTGVSVGVVGGNGAGKTTLTRLLTGALRPTDGEVRYADGVSPECDIVLVSADPQTQLLTTSVFDEVAFSLRARRMSWDAIQERVWETLAVFGLEAWAERRPWDLSIGEQLRVLTAAAVARRPRLLILDEVASMIDARAWASIQQVVESGRRRHAYGLMTITHRLEDLRATDSVTLLHEGAAVVTGSLDQIIEQALTHPEWRVDVPLAYATWSALDAPHRARFAALWPDREQPTPEVASAVGASNPARGRSI